MFTYYCYNNNSFLNKRLPRTPISDLMSQLFKTLRSRRSVTRTQEPHTAASNGDDQREKQETADSLKDGETVSLVLPSMMNASTVKELARVLKDWVNDVLAPDRIIVKVRGWIVSNDSS